MPSAQLADEYGRTKDINGNACHSLANFAAVAVVWSDTDLLLFLTDNCSAGVAHGIVYKSRARTDLGVWRKRAKSVRFIIPGVIALPN